MDPTFAAKLFELGPAGLVILGLLYALIKKDNEVSSVNEKRIAEAREAVKAIEQSTSAIEGLTQVVRERGRI